jgi:ABC-type phosphate transport system permease subunit
VQQIPGRNAYLDGLLGASLALLNRYWVMAATYDGLSFAFIVWVIVLAGCMFHRSISLLIGVPMTIAFAIFAVACMREASRFVTYQVEELVAAIASKRARNSG